MAVKWGLAGGGVFAVLFAAILVFSYIDGVFRLFLIVNAAIAVLIYYWIFSIGGDIYKKLPWKPLVKGPLVMLIVYGIVWLAALLLSYWQIDTPGMMPMNQLFYAPFFMLPVGWLWFGVIFVGVGGVVGWLEKG